MARFEIDPMSSTPITPNSHTVDVGETILWDIVAGAGIVEFPGAPEPVHFMKKDAQPGSPAIAIATHKGAKREFDVVFTAAPSKPAPAHAGATGGGGAAGATGAFAGSAGASSSAAILRARIIIR
ncbi:MAG: hypothetical protein ACKVU1_05145 [bacterium]